MSFFLPLTLYNMHNGLQAIRQLVHDSWHDNWESFIYAYWHLLMEVNTHNVTVIVRQSMLLYVSAQTSHKKRK